MILLLLLISALLRSADGRSCNKHICIDPTLLFGANLKCPVYTAGDGNETAKLECPVGVWKSMDSDGRIYRSSEVKATCNNNIGMFELDLPTGPKFAGLFACYTGLIDSHNCPEPACTPDPSSELDCPVYTKGTDKEAAKLECPEGIWQVGDIQHRWLKMTCKEEANVAAFYLGNRKAEGARCFTGVNNCSKPPCVIVPSLYENKMECPVYTAGVDDKVAKLECPSGVWKSINPRDKPYRSSEIDVSCNTETGRFDVNLPGGNTFLTSIEAFGCYTAPIDSSKCSKPACTADPSSKLDCPVYTKGTDKKAAKLECPREIYKLDDSKLFRGTAITCKEKNSVAGFYVGDKKAEGVRCFTGKVDDENRYSSPRENNKISATVVVILVIIVIIILCSIGGCIYCRCRSGRRNFAYQQQMQQQMPADYPRQQQELPFYSGVPGQPPYYTPVATSDPAPSEAVQSTSEKQ